MNEKHRIIAWQSPDKIVSNKVTRANFWGRQKMIRALEKQGYEVHCFPVKNKNNPK